MLSRNNFALVYSAERIISLPDCRMKQPSVSFPLLFLANNFWLCKTSSCAVCKVKKKKKKILNHRQLKLNCYFFIFVFLKRNLPNSDPDTGQRHHNWLFDAIRQVDHRRRVSIVQTLPALSPFLSSYLSSSFLQNNRRKCVSKNTVFFFFRAACIRRPSRRMALTIP